MMESMSAVETHTNGGGGKLTVLCSTKLPWAVGGAQRKTSRVERVMVLGCCCFFFWNAALSGFFSHR